MLIEWAVNYLTRENISVAINLNVQNGTRFGLKGNKSFVRNCTGVNDFTNQCTFQLGEAMPVIPEVPVMPEVEEG